MLDYVDKAIICNNAGHPVIYQRDLILSEIDIELPQSLPISDFGGYCIALVSHGGYSL
jgi:hypothetical protein